MEIFDVVTNILVFTPAAKVLFVGAASKIWQGAATGSLGGVLVTGKTEQHSRLAWSGHWRSGWQKSEP